MRRVLRQRAGLGTLPMSAEEAVAAGLAPDLATAGAGEAGTGLAGFLAAGAGGLSTAGIAALVAASAYGISQGTFGTPAAGAMGGYMRNINASFGAGSLTPITKALYQAGQLQSNLPGVSYDTVAGQQVPVGEQIGQLRRQGYTAPQALAKIQGEYAANTQNLSTQLGQMTASAPAAQKALSDLGVKGATLSQAMDYMTMAMVSPKDVGPGGVLDKTAMSQLAGFVKTYSLMGSGGQTTASAVLSAGSADYIMATPQMKSLSQINSALDSMTQIMTGGAANASALFGLSAAAPATLAQTLATAPGGHLTTAQQNQIAQALKGDPVAARRLMASSLGQGPFTTAGAAAWQAFTNPQTGIIPASQQNMDQLRTFMTIGGISGRQAGQLGAFELGQNVMPYVSQSDPMALAMLQQQAMQAGVPGVKMGQSLAQTRRAINAASPGRQGANQIMTQGTVAAANIPGVADFLNPNANINPLQSALYAQMAQSALATAQHPTAANVAGLTSSLGMAGVKPGQMKVGVDAVLQNLHVPSNLIAKINGEITPPKVPPVKGTVHWTSVLTPLPHQRGSGTVNWKNGAVPVIHPTTTGTINWISVMSGPLPTPGAGIPFTTAVTRHQHGFKVPGMGSGDTFPAMLEPGELVVPKHMVTREWWTT